MSSNNSFSDVLGDLPEEFFNNEVDLGLLTDSGAGFVQLECVGDGCTGDGCAAQEGGCAEKFIESVKTEQNRKINIIENRLIRSADNILAPQQSELLRALLLTPKQPKSVDTPDLEMEQQVVEQHPPKKKFKFRKPAKPTPLTGFMNEVAIVGDREPTQVAIEVKSSPPLTASSSAVRDSDDDFAPSQPPRKRLTKSKRTTPLTPPKQPPTPSPSATEDSDDDFSASQKDAISVMHKAHEKLKREFRESVLADDEFERKNAELQRSITETEKLLKKQKKLLGELKVKQESNKKQTQLYRRRLKKFSDFRFKD